MHGVYGVIDKLCLLLVWCVVYTANHQQHSTDVLLVSHYQCVVKIIVNLGCWFRCGLVCLCGRCCFSVTVTHIVMLLLWHS